MRVLASHGGKLAEVVAAAERGEAAAIEAARQLAADLLAEGQIPPEPLLSFAVAALRHPPEARRGRARTPLHRLLLIKAMHRLVMVGHDDTTAANVVASVAGDLRIAKVAGASLLKWWREIPGNK